MTCALTCKRIPPIRSDRGRGVRQDNPAPPGLWPSIGRTSVDHRRKRLHPVQHETALAQGVQACFAQRRKQVTGERRLWVVQVGHPAGADHEQAAQRHGACQFLPRTGATLVPEGDDLDQHACRLTVDGLIK